MAVKDVFRPGATNPSDPKNVKERGEEDPLEAATKFTKSMAAQSIIQSEVDKSKASAKKAEAEADEAKAKAERARLGGTEPKESPVKVTGEMSFGKINYQEILQQQLAERDELRKQAEESAGKTQQENNDLRERLHTSEMQVLKTSFDAQMQVLTKMIETSASRGSFVEQYNAVIETAKTLGLSQPQIAGDINSQIALKKMEFDQTAELRRMAREEKRADRDFQRQLNRDADEREARKVEQGRQDRRDEMFNKAPQVIGGALAQGILANQRGGGGVTQEAPVETKPSKGKHVEANWGDSGEVECPGCSQPIAIGPTARTAVCANCGVKVPIRRTGERPTAEEE